MNELEQIKKTIRMMNSSTTALEHILVMGKRNKDHEGLGFKGENSETNSLTPTKATQKGKNHYHTTRKKLINDTITASLKSYNDASLKRHGPDCHYICLNTMTLIISVILY